MRNAITTAGFCMLMQGFTLFGAELRFAGEITYRIQTLKSPALFIGVKSIENNRPTSSGRLSVRLFATESPPLGGDITGYIIGSYTNLANLPARHLYNDIAATVRYQHPPPGLYFITMALVEEADAKEILVDQITFANPIELGLPLIQRSKQPEAVLRKSDDNRNSNLAQRARLISVWLSLIEDATTPELVIVRRALLQEYSELNRQISQFGLSTSEGSQSFPDEMAVNTDSSFPPLDALLTKVRRAVAIGKMLEINGNSAVDVKRLLESEYATCNRDIMVAKFGEYKDRPPLERSNSEPDRGEVSRSPVVIDQASRLDMDRFFKIEGRINQLGPRRDMEFFKIEGRINQLGPWREMGPSEKPYVPDRAEHIDRFVREGDNRGGGKGGGGGGPSPNAM